VKRHLTISVPVDNHNAITWQLGHFLHMARDYVQDRGWGFTRTFMPGREVCMVRNTQCHAVLDSEATDVLFVDSDAIPCNDDGADIRGLGYLMDALEREDVDIVGGWSLSHGVNRPGKPMIYLPPVGGLDNPKGCAFDYERTTFPHGLSEITGGALATHCLAVKRHVLERFAEDNTQWFQDLYWDDYKRDGPKFGTRKWGHDLLFCIRAAEKGFRLWIDNRVFWGHLKSVDLKTWYQANKALLKRLEVA
jgi:hypothetical protein